MSMEELKYFFSYSRKDSEFVLQLAKDLRAAGANVWLDQLDILGGEHWDDTIEKTLKSCKGVIAVLSPESVASSNVMDEVSYALDKGKLVVPVIIRSCEIPLRLRRLQHIDFAADYDAGFSQLLRALGIEQPVQTLESAATQELVVHESTEPLEAKPTELPVHEEQAAQEVEEPSPPEATEPIPDELDHPKPKGMETQKAESKSQKTKVLAAICIVALIAIISIVVLLIILQPETYSLTATAGPNGSISPSEETTVTSGGDLTFKATLTEGYQVDTWSVDGNTVQKGGTNFKLSNIHADQTVKVTFRPLEYVVTPTAGPNGSISPSEETSVTHGGDLTFKATLTEGYQVDTWSVDGNTVKEGGTDFKLSKIHADQTVKVTFRPREYVVTPTAGDGGEISPSEKNTVTYGGDLIFKATLNEGYQVDTWSVDDNTIKEGGTDFKLSKIHADQTIKVTFRPLEYVVTPTAGPNGSISPSEETTVTYGGDLTFKVTLTEGYQVDTWSVDGNTVKERGTDFKLSKIHSDHTVKVTFRPLESVVTAYTITASADGGGEISPSGNILVNSGVDQFFSIKPEDGYQIDDVVVDGAGIGAVASHIFPKVTSDHTIAASFAPKAPVIKTNSIGMKLVYIPAGEFMMGSSVSAVELAREYDRPEGQFADEFPWHQVRISKGFRMGEKEVTQGQYKSVMNAKPWSGKSFVQENADCPAVYVTWDKAVEFCRKLSELDGKTYRLPTEAEWEYACRAGTKSRFSSIDSDSSLDGHPWFWDNTYEVCLDCAAHLVRQKEPNLWGLYDMHGNVREWCSDWYAKEYDFNSPDVDPKGPLNGSVHVVRGGSWANTKAYLRCSCRDGYDPEVGRSSVGFRIVCEE